MVGSHQDVTFICITSPSARPNRELNVHCLVLIGDHKYQLKSLHSIDALNELPEHVVALDAYLDYVGPAKRYLQDQHEYLKHFNYNRLTIIDRPSKTHYENAPIVHENIDKLRARVACQHFYRHFLTLSLSAFSITELSPSHETALLQFLNDASGLYFSCGHNDYKVSAYAEVSKSKDFETAKIIQKQLQAGTFYQDKSARFFVLHGINAQPDLAKRIQDNYRRMI
jgi:hypothetical protein